MKHLVVDDIAVVNEYHSYLGVIDQETVENLLFVPHENSFDPFSTAKNKKGYQRNVEPERVRSMAQYLEGPGRNKEITTIMVSVRLSEQKDIDRYLHLIKLQDYETILDKWGKYCSAITDGQHRCAGVKLATALNPDFRANIPVLFYFGLTYEEEVELFNMINKEQKKIATALFEINKCDITEKSEVSYEQKIRKIAASLCRDTDSVWGPGEGGQYRVNMTGQSIAKGLKRQPTYETIRRATSDMFPVELLRRLEGSDKEPLDLAKDYWRLVSETCKRGWTEEPSVKVIYHEEDDTQTTKSIKYFLKNSVGIASLGKLGGTLIATYLESSRERYETLVGRLYKVDWENRDDNEFRATNSGWAGQRELYGMLYNLVYLGKG